MKHIILPIVIAILTGSFVQAQEVLQLSLNEAQEYAIENNKSLQNARLDVDLSERKIKESIAQGLPQVDATVDWMTYFGYEIPFNFGGGGGEGPSEAEILTAMNEVMNNPRYMGVVTQKDFLVYQAMLDFEDKFIPDNTTIKMTDASTAKVQIGQLLYSGQYWAGIKVAKLGRKIAEQGLENSILDIKEAITNSYYMALVTEQSIETVKESIKNLNTVKKHTEAMFKNGMAEQTDVDQLSIQVTMLENNLRSMERGLSMVYSMMSFQLGLDKDVQIELTSDLNQVISLLDPTNTPADFEIDNNTTYQLLETQEQLTEKMVDMEKMAYTPTITGFYARNQKILTTGFDMTPNNVAGVTMNVPVFSSGVRKHKVAQAKIELDKVRINKSMLEDQLNLQQKQLIQDLNTAIENYNAQMENVAIAKRVFENVTNKYEQGMVSSLELTQTNSNYLQAESNYIQSILTLLQSKVAIDKLYNQL